METLNILSRLVLGLQIPPLKCPGTFIRGPAGGSRWLGNAPTTQSGGFQAGFLWRRPSFITVDSENGGTTIYGGYYGFGVG